MALNKKHWLDNLWGDLGRVVQTTPAIALAPHPEPEVEVKSLSVAEPVIIASLPQMSKTGNPNMCGAEAPKPHPETGTPLICKWSKRKHGPCHMAVTQVSVQGKTEAILWYWEDKCGIKAGWKGGIVCSLEKGHQGMHHAEDGTTTTSWV